MDSDLHNLLQKTLSQEARNQLARGMAFSATKMLNVPYLTVGKLEAQQTDVSVSEIDAEKVKVTYSYTAPFASIAHADKSTVGSCNLTFSYDIVKKDGEWTILDPVVQPIKVSL
jgi:hypothetical protein